MTEEQAAVLLGTDNDIDAYWDEGVFYDNFRGVWLTINGEYCAPILIESQDDYNLYTIPIQLNGKRTNLRVMYVIESEDEDGVTGSYEVLGVWDGTDDVTGVTARDITPAPGRRRYFAAVRRVSPVRYRRGERGMGELRGCRGQRTAR